MPPDIIEPPHRPRRGSGLPNWLEWATAISALVISICSIGIALYNANIVSKLLKANSYPYLFFSITDATETGPARISVDFMNNGVGPGDERSLKIRVGDRYVTDVGDLIRTALAPEDASLAVKLLVDLHDNEPTRFVASKDRALVFRIAKTAENARYWDRLDQSITSKGWVVEYCYCSVFEECWAARNDARAVEHNTRERVAACVRDEPREFMPKGHYEATPLPPA